MKRVYICAAVFAGLLALSLYTYIWTANILSETTSGVEEIRTAYASGDRAAAKLHAAKTSRVWKRLLSRQFLMADKDGIPEITELLSRIHGGIGEEIREVESECDTALLLLHLLQDKQRAVL
ncbi:hypothetical protein FACS1894120_4360 [Clostridia bacterium]|nr:hypothetical protein FACS1894120_4360 [Clostridia bacterium]